MSRALPPGAIVTRPGSITLNAGLPVTEVAVTNTGEVPVHLSAHFHVFEANPRLRFDRRAAYRRRLDLPSAASVRFEPGETRTVCLVPIGGDRIIRGFSGLVDGPLDEPGVLEAALGRLQEHGYWDDREDPGDPAD